MSIFKAFMVKTRETLLSTKQTVYQGTIHLQIQHFVRDDLNHQTLFIEMPQ